MKKSLLKILSFVCALVLVLSTFAYANGLVNPFATFEGLTLAATVRTPVGVPLDLNAMGVKFPENTLVAPNQLENLKVKSVMTGFRRMIAEGHIIGNHTWSHPDCPQKNLLEIQDDIFKCNQYMKDTFNYDMKLFRYPYGYFSEMLLKFIGLQGFVQLFWSYGYRDWIVNEQPDEASSKRKIINAACPGMIYLLHAESTTNANILGDCIDGIRAKGFLVGDCADFLKY